MITDSAHRSARRVVGLATALTTAAALAAVVADKPAAAVSVAPASSVTVVMLGNGHGHGMSQYGARGAARAGLSARQIVAFYYPHTKLVTLPRSSFIRVGLSGTGTRLAVAPATDLMITGVDSPLPSAGIGRLRLAAGKGRGLVLQKRDSARHAEWVTLRTGVPNRSAFYRRGGGAVRLLKPDGTSVAYKGRLRAVRNTAKGRAGGVIVVNRVGLDSYAAGVVPMEMPTSWENAAVNAQAIAARTYGAYHLAHPLDADYDICDTTQCQVYGGHAHYSGTRQLTWRDYPRAARATARRVLEYRGSIIFAQFSASNGGWTVAGGQPYLRAKADPYDNATSGDPYLNYRKKVSVSSVAGYFGLQKATGIVITERDGNGTWHGRVLAGYVEGVTSAGKAKRVPASGYDLAGAFGIGTTWFVVRAAAS